MSRVILLVGLTSKIKSQLDRAGSNDTILGLLVLVRKNYEVIKHYCNTPGSREVINQISALAEEIKNSIISRHNFAKMKAEELLNAAEQLAQFPSLKKI